MTISITDAPYSCTGGGDETARVKAAIRDSMALGVPLNFENRTLKVSETLAPGDYGETFTWLGGADIEFNIEGTYRPVENADGSDSGMVACLDLKGTRRNSMSSGRWLFQSSSKVGNMKLASRQGLEDQAGHMAGMAASSKAQFDGQHSCFGDIHFQQLGVAVFNPLQKTGNARTTPFTGTTFERLSAKLCLQALVAQSNGNDFDDMAIKYFEIAQCGGDRWQKAAVKLIATYLTVQNAFFRGYTDNDEENPTATVSLDPGEDPYRIALSAPLGVEVGDFLSFRKKGRYNPLTDTYTGMVAEIVMVSPDQMTLHSKYPFDEALDNEPFVLGPPVGAYINGSDFIVSGTFYPEFHILPVIVGANGHFQAKSLHLHNTGFESCCALLMHDTGTARVTVGNKHNADKDGPIRTAAAYRLKANDDTPSSRIIRVGTHTSTDWPYDPIAYLNEQNISSRVKAGTSVPMQPGDGSNDDARINEQIAVTP